MLSIHFNIDESRISFFFFLIKHIKEKQRNEYNGIFTGLALWCIDYDYIPLDHFD